VKTHEELAPKRGIDDAAREPELGHEHLAVKAARGHRAQERAAKRVVVDDVELFPGHITCDARARSEIVVPVFNRMNDLIAVLDVDSEELSFFSEEDRIGLEGIVKWFKRTL